MEHTVCVPPRTSKSKLTFLQYFSKSEDLSSSHQARKSLIASGSGRSGSPLSFSATSMVSSEDLKDAGVFMPSN
jgi:hypothetical protein